MKAILSSFLALGLTLALTAAEKKPVDPVLQGALAGLEKRLELRFDKPFPDNWDIDAHSKQPVGLIGVNGSKLSATRPMVNPYDGEGTIEWMMGPEKSGEMPKANLGIILHLDEAGEFFQISMVAAPDNWPFEKDLLRREEKETGAEFFRRAMLAYRVRAKKAADQAQAELFLAGAEKIAGAIQVLYKEALVKKGQ